MAARTTKTRKKRSGVRPDRVAAAPPRPSPGVRVDSGSSLRRYRGRPWSKRSVLQTRRCDKAGTLWASGRATVQPLLIELEVSLDAASDVVDVNDVQRVEVT